jgi:hypothetical protein
LRYYRYRTVHPIEDPLLLLLLYSKYGSKYGTKLVKKAKIFGSIHPSLLSLSALCVAGRGFAYIYQQRGGVGPNANDSIRSLVSNTCFGSIVLLYKWM